MGLADEFTAEMARTVTDMENAEDILSSMTEKNALVSYFADRSIFRFHHMMKERRAAVFII